VKEVHWTGAVGHHSADEMLRFHFAFLRGGTQLLDKFWAMSIYGQCDPAIAQRTLTLVCDMGTRYLYRIIHKP
jgi:hypothetical protein